jgi:hypothetical protein
LAFVSVGYDGPIDERQWAELIPSVGSSFYGVKGPQDLQVTAVAGAPMTVSVAPGTAWGMGVMDTELGNTTLECDPIASGTRWDLIALRRDWQPTAGGPSSLAVVKGTATAGIPAARLNEPGVQDDQPLALVQWTAGKTNPTAIIDLRCWAGNGGLFAKSDMVKQYLNRIGTRISVYGQDWLYTVTAGSAGVPLWIEIGGVRILDPLTVGNWGVEGNIYKTPVGGLTQITVDVNVRRTGANVTIDGDGAWVTIIPGMVPPDARGTWGEWKYFPISVVGGGNNYICNGALNPITGAVSIKPAFDPSFLFTKNALFGINLTYYI